MIGNGKSYETISLYQFQKLFKPLTGKTNLIKPDFDIVYKNILRKYECNVMDLYAFFDALEVLANKAFKDNFSENLEKLLDMTLDYY